MSQCCAPPPATMSGALVKALGLQAKGLSTVSEGKEEADERKQVGLVRVQALLQEQQVELAQRRKQGGEARKWDGCLRSRAYLARRTRGPEYVPGTRRDFVQARKLASGTCCESRHDYILELHEPTVYTPSALDLVCAVSHIEPLRCLAPHTCIIEAAKATALGRNPTESAAPAAQRHQHAVRTASALGEPNSPRSRNPWPKLNTFGATSPAADGELL